MVLQVNQEFCSGCGVCVDTCCVGAIQMVGLHAVIDEALCTQCEFCVDACPNGAITVRSVSARCMPVIVPPAAESCLVPVQGEIVQPDSAMPARGLAPLAGAALAFLGREVAPRLVDVLINSLERRLAQPTTSAMTPISTSSRSLTSLSRGKQRQARFRGGRIGYRNLKGRR